MVAAASGQRCREARRPPSTPFAVRVSTMEPSSGSDWSGPGRSLVTSLRHFNRALKPVPNRCHRFDVARAADVISQQAAQQRDAARQRALGYRRIAPNRIKQFFLRDQPLRVVQQE